MRTNAGLMSRRLLRGPGHISGGGFERWIWGGLGKKKIPRFARDDNVSKRVPGN